MLGKWVAVLLLASPAGIAASQQPASTKPDQAPSQAQTQAAAQNKAQQDSLAAAARLAREQQKTQPRATKVWDNDNLPAAPTAVSVVGSAPAAPAESADQSASAATTEPQQGKTSAASAVSGADRKADLQKQLDAARAHLKSAQTDLDIANRTYQLDQQTYYSNPDYSSDRAGAAKLKNEQSDIDAKKQAVDAAQKQVDDLTARLQDLQSNSANPSPTPQ
jgi:hypothetical protein